MGIVLLLCAPVVCILTALARHRRTTETVHTCLYAFSCAVSAGILYRSFWLGERFLPANGFFFCDALSAFFIFTVSVIAFCVVLYSTGFMKQELTAGQVTVASVMTFYLLLDLFVLAMLCALAVNNAVFMWICIEMTTLVSAFLVGFNRTKESVEAAWKYIIICTVGIILALVGTILFYHAFGRSGTAASLSWTTMLSQPPGSADTNIARAAFIFIVIGYGTKAGLAPMHTWLPDAHSQAVSPASALLSGVLLKTALYAIIRYSWALKSAGQEHFSAPFLTLFGIACLAVAAGFVFVQKDLKRLLAYSSIEHVGVICVALGIGGPLAFAGVLLHVFAHAATKSMMFLSAGRIVSRYATHSMRQIKGVIAAMPFCGGIFLFGAFALSGFPPFSLFVSELMVLSAAFLKGAYWAGGMLLFSLTTVFAGMAFHFSRMLPGRKPAGFCPASEPASIRISLCILMALVLLAGLAAPFLIPASLRMAVVCNGAVP